MIKNHAKSVQKPSEVWWNSACKLQFAGKPNGGTFIEDAPFRGVLHTTQSQNYKPSTKEYYGNTNAPHFTIVLMDIANELNVCPFKDNERRAYCPFYLLPLLSLSHQVKKMMRKMPIVYQHYPINVASRALANKSGGVETNRQGAIQIEIAWTAENIRKLPHEMMEQLKRLMRWIEKQTGILKYASGFSTTPNSMGFEKWKSFNGWCGHQHVPENINSHWDPGKIDIDTLLGRSEYQWTETPKNTEIPHPQGGTYNVGVTPSYY